MLFKGDAYAYKKVTFRMRRSDLLAIVGMTTTTFNAMVARGVTPFSRTPGRGWSVFTIEDALRLAVFSDLTTRGMSQPRAGALVREGFDPFLDFINSKPEPASGSLLFGQVELRNRSDEAAEAVIEPLYAVTDQLDKALTSTLRKGDGQWELSAMMAVNATESMRRILLGYRRGGVTDVEAARWADFMRVTHVRSRRTALP